MGKLKELAIVYEDLEKLDLGYEFSDCGRTYRQGKASVEKFRTAVERDFSVEERQYVLDVYTKNTDSEYLVRKAKSALGL